MADRYWVGGTGTWNATSTTNWAASSGGTSGASVPTAADNVIFDNNSNVGTGAFTVTTGVSTRPCLSFTVTNLDGAMTLAGTIGVTVSGSMTLPATNFSWTNSATLTFAATTSQTITSGGNTIASPITFNGTGGTWALQDALNCTGSVVTLTTGTLDLNGYTLTCPTFSASGSTARTIAFGSTGIINLTGTGIVWQNAVITSFSYTGTSNIRLTNAGSTAITLSTGPGTAAQSMNFSVTAGTYALSLSATSNMNSLNFTGFSGSFTLASAVTIYGDLTLSATTTSTAVAQTITFGGTSVTQIFTTADRNIGCSININGSSNTVRLVGTLTQTAARGFTLTSGTLDINSQTTSVGILTIVTGTKAITNGTLNAASVTHTSGAIAVTSTATIATSGAYTFTAGSIDIGNGAVLSMLTFVGSGTGVRSIAFNTSGELRVTGSGTNVWNNATSTNFSYSGNSNIRLTYSGAVATSIATGQIGITNIATQILNFYITAGTYTATISSTSVINTLDFTGFSGTYSQATSNITLYGNLVYSSSMVTTTTAGSGFITMAATSGTDTITTNGITINNNIRFNGVGGTFRLADNFTQGTTSYFSIVNGTVDFNDVTYSLGVLEFQTGTNSYINYGGTLNPASIIHTSGTVTHGTGALLTTAGSYTFTAGTLNINNGLNLTVGSFSSNNSNTRVINYGTGSINITGNAATVCNILFTTGYTFSGTPIFQFSYSGSTGTRTINVGSALTGNQALRINITNGSDTIAFTSGMTTNDVNFTGFSGTWSNVAFSLHGSLTLSPTMIVGAGTGTMTFAATTGVRTITSNGETIDFPISMTGGATLRLADAFVQGSTRAFGFTSGTLDLNGQTNSFGVFTVATGTHAIANGTVNAASVAHNSGNLTIGSSNNLVCTGTYTFTAGSITINDDFNLTCGAFYTAISNTRSIAFGTSGSITVNSSSGGSIFEHRGTGFSYTGSGRINISTTTSNATSISLGTTTEAQALNYFVTTGSYSLSMVLNASTGALNTLDFTGFSGTFAQGAVAVSIYKDLTLSPTMSSTTTTGKLVFDGTSNSVITSNGGVSGIRIEILKASGTPTVTLGDAYSSNITSGTGFVISRGTFTTANYNLTLDSFSTPSLGAVARTVNLGSSYITIVGSGSAWNVDPTATVATINAGTSTISMTSASAKTFIGGVRTYYILNQGGSGALTVTGANSFNDITATTRPSTVTLPSATTTTVSNFTLSGTAGNLVTLNSSTAGTRATLSKSSGTVTTNYLSIQDSAATGGATWLAPTNLGNVNSGNNTGWNFAAIVVALINSNFFVFF